MFEVKTMAAIKGTPLPWATDAKLVRNEETEQFVCDLNDDDTRANWLAWGIENNAI